jgi:hypothetical protein
MVLNFVLPIIALIVSLFAPLSFAQTEENKMSAFRFTIRGKDCVIRVRKGKDWEVSPLKFSAGTTGIGRLTDKNSDVLVFRLSNQDGDLLAAKASCILGQDQPVTDGNLKAAESGISALKPVDSGSVRISIGGISWQEPLTAKFGSQQKNLRATNFGTSLHFQFYKRDQDEEWALGIQPFYAKARISAANIDSTTYTNRATGETTDANDPEGVQGSVYGVKNIDVFGGALNLGYYFHPHSGNVAFGVMVPLMIRYGVYPTGQIAGADVVNAGPKLWFLTGAYLESRLEEDIYSFSTRVGFLNRPSSLAWTIEGGVKF